MPLKEIMRKKTDDEQRVIVPMVNIEEREAEILLNAEMPGLDKKEISVEVHGDDLAIRGSRVNHVPEGYKSIFQERIPVEYKRTFTLGNQINRDSIKANYENGILRVYLQKTESAQPRKITIA